MKNLLEIKNIVANFNNLGENFVMGNRNVIKIFKLNNNTTINIKSFKKPNLINKIVYRYFRKSKGRRSFEHASKLIKMQIGTPQPIAYFEKFDFIGLKESYYACEHLENVFEFREIVQNEAFINREEIIRQFIQFTFQMHQIGVEFLDHSPGNTLIRDNNNGNYTFYLVDLNRMKFHETIDFHTRMKNLSKITHKKDMIAMMSNEYAKLSSENEVFVFETLWKLTSEFQFRFYRKKRIKKKLKFWKK
ncbi:lipopolysaccharide kinase InaA family protein [Flavobacterium sp.]|jgi:hypothetical protein|uniref:lipopolysaccharide kinase InaA family protein n=1 Tax=Flavobacterium sp. TaxID=239 RepID=UPI0037C1524E